MCPSYSFKDINTNDQFTTVMSMAEREEFLKTNPHIQQQIIAAPALGDSIRMGMVKPDNAFRDHLKEIKKKHSKGLTRSTINTF
jgi:hypothetical protein